MIASSISGFGGIVYIPEVMPEAEVIEINAPREIKRMTVEEYVRIYFSDIPVMVEIAKCESRFRQHDSRGDVLRGEENSLDRGVMQINEYYHGENSEKLGYDIMTIEGNTSYARYLFDKYGVRPWVSSSRCWGKTIAYTEYQELAIQSD